MTTEAKTIIVADGNRSARWLHSQKLFFASPNQAITFSCRNREIKNLNVVFNTRKIAPKLCAKDGLKGNTGLSSNGGQIGVGSIL